MKGILGASYLLWAEYRTVIYCTWPTGHINQRYIKTPLSEPRKPWVSTNSKRFNPSKNRNRIVLSHCCSVVPFILVEFESGLELIHIILSALALVTGYSLLCRR